MISHLNAFAYCVLCLPFIAQNRADTVHENGLGHTDDQGISVGSAITVTDEELLRHFHGEWPTLHVGSDQTEKDWPDMTNFSFEVIVSDTGDVVRADFQPGTIGESHTRVVERAAALVRSQRFVPFRRGGHAVFVRSTAYVRILPPESIPTEHVPFPSLANRRTLLMTLSRSSCFGYCPKYRIQIHGDGLVEYDGNCAVAVTGHRESHIPQQVVDALFEQFRKADFFSLDDRYIQLVMDPPRQEVSISFDGHEKKVAELMGEDLGMPDAVLRLEQTLDKATNSTQWTMGGWKTFIEAAKSHPCKL